MPPGDAVIGAAAEEGILIRAADRAVECGYGGREISAPRRSPPGGRKLGFRVRKAYFAFALMRSTLSAIRFVELAALGGGKHHRGALALEISLLTKTISNPARSAVTTPSAVP